MLRYDRQIKPGLVALYDIQPGNGSGLFLQPRILHGAKPLTRFKTLLSLNMTRTTRAASSGSGSLVIMKYE